MSRFFPEIFFVILKDLLKWGRYFIREAIPENILKVLRCWKKKFKNKVILWIILLKTIMMKR